ncbi:hypothetical protein [Pseudomonas viridiflava]|uniref:hypothetical protein n=1 Tax=Pseudomonas viridiflava TaxID=33069 RepID=UPI0013CEDC37|nr:hypothetical protein [Pseudomonas viridiflava]
MDKQITHHQSVNEKLAHEIALLNHVISTSASSIWTSSRRLHAKARTGLDNQLIASALS